MHFYFETASFLFGYQFSYAVEASTTCGYSLRSSHSAIAPLVPPFHGDVLWRPVRRGRVSFGFSRSGPLDGRGRSRPPVVPRQAGSHAPGPRGALRRQLRRHVLRIRLPRAAPPRADSRDGHRLLLLFARVIRLQLLLRRSGSSDLRPPAWVRGDVLWLYQRPLSA